MFEKLGRKSYAVPLAVAVVIACVMSLMFFPVANMEMKELPFAVLSLDEGVETPQGTVNAGDAIIENIAAASESEDGAESPIAWTKVGSREELDESLENGEFYGALIVPASFSADQAAAKQAEAQAALAQAQALQAAAAAGAQAQAGAPGASSVDPVELDQADRGSASDAATPTLEVVLDNAKSPLVANQMKSGIASMFQQLGVEVEVETIHAGGVAPSQDDAATASPMAGMLSQQMTIMPLFLMSMVGALVLSRVFKAESRASKPELWKSLGVQTAYAVAVSLIASLCVYGMLSWVAGVEAPMAGFVLFSWLASFCVMLLFLGAFNLSLGLGGFIVLCGLAGIMCGVLPYEALPAFWQDWVYPWAPQRFIGEGLRAVLYLDAGAWNAASGPLTAIGTVGVVLAGFSVLLPSGKRAA